MRRYHNELRWLTILLFGVLFCSSLRAQKIFVKKPKLYESWTTFRNEPVKQRGLLYQINDSSVVIADTKSRTVIQAGRFRQTIIPAGNIEVLKVRRTESIRRGATIGGSILGISFLVLSISEREAYGEFASLIIPEITIIGAAVGAGAGAAIGSFRDIVLIKGSIENFNLNRGRLQHYSYITEYPAADRQNATDHKCYIGLVIGPSYPLGDFLDKSSANPNAGFARTGSFGSIINVGYRIKDNFGISVSLFDNQYDVGKENSVDWWDVGGEMIGPMYTISLHKRLLFDIKPRIGLVEAQLIRDEELLEDGRGLGLNLNASLQCNITKRISVLVESGYFTSRLRFTSEVKKNISCYDFGFGAAYRFR